METVKATERFDEPVTEEVLAQAIKRGRNRKLICLHDRAVQYVPAQLQNLAKYRAMTPRQKASLEPAGGCDIDAWRVKQKATG